VVAAGTVAELCALTGRADFEEAFVQLAFTDAERGASGAPGARP
jgi:hypothetical protein